MNEMIMNDKDLIKWQRILLVDIRMLTKGIKESKYKKKEKTDFLVKCRNQN